MLVQGQAPREALLTQFRALGNAVLLATGSFWEGVDVKGDALSIVAIDKLPFAAPDDPLLAARLEGIRRRGGNPFVEYQLPQAVLALKQGVGSIDPRFRRFRRDPDRRSALEDEELWARLPRLACRRARSSLTARSRRNSSRKRLAALQTAAPAASGTA